MNILEQYIKEIISEEDITEELHSKGYGMQKEWVRVILKVDCYGSVRRQAMIFSKEEWEISKARGYYWG